MLSRSCNAKLNATFKETDNNSCEMKLAWAAEIPTERRAAFHLSWITLLPGQGRQMVIQKSGWCQEVATASLPKSQQPGSPAHPHMERTSDKSHLNSSMSCHRAIIGWSLGVWSNTIPQLTVSAEQRCNQQQFRHVYNSVLYFTYSLFVLPPPVSFYSHVLRLSSL